LIGLALRGAILDYGNTLITFEGDVAEVRVLAHRALLESLRRDGLAPREPSFLDRWARKFLAYERKRSIDHLEPTAMAVLVATIQEEGLPPQAEGMLRRALRSMYEVFEAQWKLFPDSQEALEKIRGSGLRMAMLSNASDEDNVRRMLAAHKLESFFDPVIISAAVGIRKPDARAFRPILAAWDLPAREIVMIGDQLEADILGAKKLGLRTIWLTTEENSPTNRPFRGKVSADAQVKTIGEAAALLVHWKEQGPK
jgi:HAD superfamily hydrolase (TIGR01662 family)